MTRTEPRLVCGDRVHYLHSPDEDVPSIERRHIKVDGTEVGLLRWIPAADRRSSAALALGAHGWSAHLSITAEELRTIAAAMLQCAAELDTAEPPVATQAAALLPHPAAHSYTLGGAEATPWRLPEVA